MLKRTSAETPQTLDNRPAGWLPVLDGHLAIFLVGLLPQVLDTLINGGRTMKEH